MINPFILMLLAIVMYGFFPVALAESGRQNIPMEAFVLGIHVIGFFFIGLTILLGQSRLKLDRKNLTAPLKNRKVMTRMGLGMVFNLSAEVALFFAVLGELRVQGSVIYELWPIVFLLLAWVLRPRDEGGIKVFHDSATTLLLFIIGAIGLIMIALSSGGSPASLMEFLTVDRSIGWGIIAAVAMGLSAFYTTGAIRAFTGLILPGEAERPWRERLGPPVICLLWFRAISLVIAFFVYLAFQKGLGGLGEQIALLLGTPGVWYGGLVVGIGGFLFHLANVQSKNANINLLWYMVPVIGTASFVLFGYSKSLDSNFFQGLLLVVAANFGLNLSIDMTKSFRALLITICFSSIALNYMPRITSPYYFETLSVVTSMFAIIIAFVLNRAYTKRSLINDSIARIYFHSLALNDAAVAEFSRAVFAKEMDMKKAETLIQKYLYEKPDLAHDMVQILRQRDVWISFGELFSVWLLGLGTVAIAILSLPAQEYPATFFPVILSTVTIFLCSNLTEVSRPILAKADQNRGFDRLGFSIDLNEKMIKFDVLIGILFVLVLLLLHAATTWY